MVVAYRSDGETFVAETPRQLFEGRFEGAIFSNYDISPAGDRFIMIRSDSNAPREIHVVLNWFEELRRLVPTED